MFKNRYLRNSRWYYDIIVNRNPAYQVDSLGEMTEGIIKEKLYQLLYLLAFDNIQSIWQNLILNMLCYKAIWTGMNLVKGIIFK